MNLKLVIVVSTCFGPSSAMTFVLAQPIRAVSVIKNDNSTAI
jgi:hypothetical protein